MRSAPWLLISDRCGGRPWLVACLLAAVFVSGCGHEAKIKFADVSAPPIVRLMEPPIRKIVRVVGQPSFVQSYEHTGIYAKLICFIEKWNVDIGDKVKKGDVLAKLFMPELVQELQTKRADVELAKQMIDRASNLDEEARADVEAALSHAIEAQSMIAKFQAEVDRWETEVSRLQEQVTRGVVAPQILTESKKELKSNIADRDAAKSAYITAKAQIDSRKAASSTSRVEVGVARARLTVATSEEKRLEAMVGYLTLTAPFDGIVVVRNANTGDFAIPSSGDPSARAMSPDLSPDRSAPIFVVDRIDVVRIFVDIPEGDADFVQKGNKASVLVEAYSSRELPATVTRTAWALNVTSRTLRAEIDLPNPDGKILPGMYAYGRVIIERPGVRSLPLDALVYSGAQTYCWMYEKGHAIRTEVRTGISDGDWIEVTNRRVPVKLEGTSRENAWSPIDGKERVILGDLSVLTDGGSVSIATDKAADNTSSDSIDQNRTNPRSDAIVRSR